MPVRYLPSRHSGEQGVCAVEAGQMGRILSLTTRLPISEVPGSEGTVHWMTQSGKHYAYRASAPVPQIHATRDADEVARRYLKLILPAIPITAFVLTFLYVYLLVGVSAAQSPAVQGAGAPIVNPLLPLFGALLVAVATGMICLIAYLGYQRVLAQARSRTTSPADASCTSTSSSQM